MIKRLAQLLCGVLFVFALAGASQAQETFFVPEQPLADAKLEEMAQTLFRGLRCLVCEAEALASSPAPFARELRQAVRLRLQAGDNETQINQWLGASYGDEIFLKPPVRGATLFLWLAPFALLGVVLVCWWRVLVKNNSDKNKKPKNWWSRGESNP